MQNKINMTPKNFRLVTVDSYGSGFFGNYFTVLSNIIAYNNLDLIPYVNLNKTVWVNGYDPRFDKTPPENAENPWDWWFEQQIPTENDIIQTFPFAGNEYFPANLKVWKRRDVPVARSIADRYIKIRPHILKKVEDFYNTNLKGHNVLGVMARGAEMNHCHPEYGNQNLETWINYTRYILSVHPEIDKIFFVSEESSYIEPFINEFPNTIYIKDVFRRTNETLEELIKFSLLYCLTGKRENHKQLLGEECLIQALLLAKSDYLLTKQCGTSSGAIFYSDGNLKDVYYAD